MEALELQNYFRGMHYERLLVIRSCYERLVAKHKSQHWKTGLNAINDLIGDMQSRPQPKQLSIFEHEQ